ncbi:MAG: hypothetical protein KKA73_19010 [Chloroflexi bacterium]|nr:hypothetical protein [Chloroflexota bacterium]MBU1749780.1 hypothetical protein [Chloroflexota bacterium]MBU1878579.1 hypothetical protein [Chloroflexota bacterium]
MLLLLRLLVQRLSRQRQPVLVPAACPLLTDRRAEPVTELPKPPAPGPGRLARVARVVPAASLGLGYAGLLIALAVLIGALLGLRRSAPRPE